ncbi:DNA repair protein RecN (Recombination protein N) [Persephonella hydrogeniphila]|uniref:DNA repair protein RecN n=1 Tax=Persephonella hydrogeniphila TaxID=198703 RepID=A0A285NN47_9AQUI|nr:DNA repair protein RecN [Persephonella hydrogeniphila]SNZ09051.1 DNA repair protein RecN (Recombination protein N) [Persephonella hydrogeniphila]
MLSKIRIEKFLYLKDVDIDLDRGLNVFTGETGVGKSLIVDAVSFVLGKKGKFSEGDYVELVFEDVENGYSEDGVLILAREIKNGKNIYYINGRRATLTALKEASEGLLTIHGQNQQQKLFEREKHREILDTYAGIGNLLEEYRELYRKYRELEKQEEYLKNQQSNRLREIDILNFQLNELEEASIKEGEKEYLEEKYRYLTNISRIKEAVYRSEQILFEEEGSVNEKLSLVIKELEKISDFSEEIKNVIQSLEEAKAIIDDASYSLNKVEVDFEQSEIQEIEERLNLINRLEIKYNTDEKGLITLKNQFKERLEYLKNLEFELPKIEKEKRNVYKKLLELAEKISLIRKEKAKELEKSLKTHLEELALNEAKFVVEITDTEIGKHGKDDVLFLFSANKGFDPMPVEEVASGGEVSRLSLSIKLVAGSDVDCMIFDEVDSGIGGKTALFMAKKLKKLSEKYQVILITHLPQIAVYGDKHFYIEKQHTSDYTFASIKQLETEERIKEIARMLSGKTDRQTVQLAKQLLQSAE